MFLILKIRFNRNKDTIQTQCKLTIASVLAMKCNYGQFFSKDTSYAYSCVCCFESNMLIDFVNDFNNREMICHEKSTLQISTKPDIICDPMHELISNSASQV